jgi:high-affinity iron transporter
VTWGDIVPDLLTGLREGLAAGLVVSTLLAAVRRAAPARVHGGRGDEGRTRKISAAPIWLGVLGAVMLSASAAAVLTSSTNVVSRQAQDVVGGLLSVFAVGLVTAVIFWIRGIARGLKAELRDDMAREVPIGAGALTITAFLAVGRESLETALSLWTAARAPGPTAGPLAGTAAGLAGAAALCWLLYRAAARLSARVFFNRAALALIVIAAGVLANGLGQLQDASLLPGQRWTAFDLAARAHPGSWWVSLITGVTNLSPKMTVLQVVAWIAYLTVVIPAFAKVAGSRRSSRHSRDTATTDAARRWQGLAGQRPWAVAGVLVVVPALAAGATIAALPAASSASAAAVTVTVTRTGCARDWTSATAGSQTFTVDNQSGVPGEINLDDASGDIVAEIETIGPRTSAQLSATLYNGTYVFKCFMGSLPATVSPPVEVTGAGSAAAASPTATLLPVAATLAGSVAVLRQNLTSDDLAGDPTNLPVRTHEILEDALRDHLSGIDDQGGGAAFAQTYADVDVTRAVLGYLAPLINSRQPGLPAIADSQLDLLDGALLATRVSGQWEPLAAASAAAREHVGAAIDAVLETIAAVPDLLEVRPAR